MRTFSLQENPHQIGFHKGMNGQWESVQNLLKEFGYKEIKLNQVQLEKKEGQETDFFSLFFFKYKEKTQVELDGKMLGKSLKQQDIKDLGERNKVCFRYREKEDGGGMEEIWLTRGRDWPQVNGWLTYLLCQKGRGKDGR